MDLLADENVDKPLVNWLREQGHDVSSVADLSAGSDDESVLQLAIAQRRVLLTFDRHFGELVFRHGLKPVGIVLVRIRARTAEELYLVFRNHWTAIETRVMGNFVTMSRHRVRLRRL